MPASNGNQSQVQEYTLFMPPNSEGQIKHFATKCPNWQELAQMHGFHVLDIHENKAIVAATIESIISLKEKNPVIQISPQIEEYTLFVPLYNDEQRDIHLQMERPNWQELAKIFGLHVLRDRKSQAVVTATEDSINQLQEKFPFIQVTSQKRYYKLGFIL
jgi:hypothetical protein